MLCLLLAVFLTPPQATPDQSVLLKTFRAEFVSITPGIGRFPAAFPSATQENLTEKKSHRITRDFAIAKFELTQELWEAIMGHNPSRWKGQRNSVEMISFSDAQKFCQRATERMRKAGFLLPTEEIRLPTEMEWEYAVRAGTDTAYSFGDDRNKLNDYAWSKHNAAGNDPPVGAKKPNPWGLYDVHGYLAEWCIPQRTSSQEKPPSKDIAVLRGGSWKDPAEKLTSRSRTTVPITLRDDAVGVRCVLAKLPAGSRQK